MFKAIRLSLLVVVVCVTTGSGLDFEITKVVEVGPAAWVPFTGPLKWSPDGTMLAYFTRDQLMISDTLGKPRGTMRIELGVRPVRYEWISDDEIALQCARHYASDSIVYTMHVVSPVSRANIEVDRTVRQLGITTRMRTAQVTFDGPYLTLEGEAYYLRQTHTGRTRRVPRGRWPETVDEPVYFYPEKAAEIASQHKIGWNTDGLHLSTLDGTDSTRLTSNLFAKWSTPTVISSDGTHVMNGGTILRLQDSTFIVLDTLPYYRPAEGLACGFLWVSFNPVYTEALFNLGCDDGHIEVYGCIGVFDYESMDFQILDTLTNLTGCTTPVYAPDGRRIAFLSDGMAYILYRELRL